MALGTIKTGPWATSETEAYLGPWKTSMMERFAKIVNSF